MVFPHGKAVPSRMSSTLLWVDHGDMSHAIVWSENDQPAYAGRVEVTPRAVVLSGRGEGRPEAHREVRFGDLVASFLERRVPAAQVCEPALVLVTRDGDRVAIGSLEGLGALHELADEVACARGQAAA